MNKDKSARVWARDILQGAGLRATPARVATLLVLRDASSPLTHAEVTDRLIDHDFDKATIYRNLSDMSSANLLRRSELGDHVWRFQINIEEDHSSHPHFVCVDCGSVTCLNELELTKKSKLASERFGQITEILLRGHCNDCN